MFNLLDVYDDAAPQSAALNMAIDEALLSVVTTPSIRFYRWRSPALSFGYFGRFADVEHEQANHELVRRWTGGGVVFHGNDLTYSVILPSSTPAAAKPSRVLYSEIHDAIRRALGENVGAKLASSDAPRSSDACFANPVKADVIVGGQKIAGAAQRRTRAGLLHQGSIQYDDLKLDFTDRLAAALGGTVHQKRLTTNLLLRAERLAQGKYSTAAWLQRV